ncbi:MAG: caspase family protein [Alphaproteobacteria bacterium]|nr:caspase family protein [Alphaproteobacteria bacterium]
MPSTRKLSHQGLRLLVLAASAIILNACFTVAPNLSVQQMSVPITLRHDMDVALVVPPATRSFSTAHEIPGPCIGGVQFQPTPYGETLVNTVHNRLSFMYSSVTILPAAQNLDDYDAAFTLSMTEAGMRFACGFSPVNLATVKGGFQAVREDGSPIWAATRTEGRDEAGLLYDMDFNGAYGRQFSKAIANLADGWISELMMARPEQYAFNFDGDSMQVASNSRNKKKKGFSTKALKLDYRAAPEDPDDIMVIISNGNYQNLSQDIPNIVPAYADGNSMKEYAQKSLGIRKGNIIDLQDATSAQLVSVFGSRDNHKGKLYDWVRPNRSKVYVYYVGHGAPSNTDGSAYLVPVDADSARIDLNGYPLETLYANLSKLKAQEVTVIVEACFSGASNEGSVISNASPVYLQAKESNIPQNINVITAGSLNQIASWEEDKSNSLFTKYFLTGQSGAADRAPYGNNDGKVSFNEIKKYLDDTLSYFARRYYGRNQNAQIHRSVNAY